MSSTRRALLPLAALVFFGLMMPVLSHSTKTGTVPEDGAVLGVPPETIELRFDAPMRITLITLTDAAGQEFGVARDKSLVARAHFIARPETLPPGAYKVEWRGLAEDGHAMRGTFSFTVE